MRPIVLPAYLTTILSLNDDEKIALIHKANANRTITNALVSVVVPAYNEENNILNLILSLSSNITKYAFEIIIVNNNSKDRTEQLVNDAGVTCINETKKGVVAARTAGLMAAKGIYILNADADSIYPPNWIEQMIPPLEEGQGFALTYGRFAFIPSGSAQRWVYFLYESVADVLRLYKKLFKEEAMNVYGCNSGFRKEQCLQVNTYEHPVGANEDGWLAVKLRNKGFGKLKYIGTNDALVWTVDRHLQNDGGLWKAFKMRISNVFGGQH